MSDLIRAALSIVIVSCVAGAEPAETRAPASIDEMVASGDLRGVTVPINGANTCAGAAAISGFGMWQFDLAGATTDGVGHPLCQNAQSDQIWRDRWWRWTSPVTGLVRVETCGQTNVDTRLAVYSPGATCPPTSEYLINCDDDACNPGLESSLVFAARAGQSYLIRLGKYGSSEPSALGFGTFTIFSTATADTCPDDVASCQAYIDNGTGYNSNAGFRTADDFIADATGASTGLCFWGSYFATAPLIDDFTITYWSHSIFGLPGIPLASFSQADGTLAVIRSATNDENIIGGTIFLYTATHDQFAIADGVRYWVEVRNFYGSAWYWQRAAGENGSYQDFSPEDPWGNATARPNLAFCVQASSGCNVDVNGDGVIDFGDLNAVISVFNTDCP